MKVSKLGVAVSKLLAENDRQAYLVGECVLELVVYNEIKARLEIATNASINELFSIFSENPAYDILYTTNDRIVARPTRGEEVFTLSVYKTIYDGAARTVDEYLFAKGINVYSMGYDAIKEELVDPLDVQQDIKDQIVKVNSEWSFMNDTKLTFRLAFVCAQLGYKLDGKSAMYAAKDAFSVEYMPSATIRNELDKYFAELKRPSVALRILNRVGVLKRVLPEFSYSKGYKLFFTDVLDLYNHTLKVIDLVPKGRPLVRWAALFHDLGKMRSCDGYDTANVKFPKYRDQSAKVAMEVMGRLIFSKKEIFTVERIVKNELQLPYSTEKELLSFVDKVGPANIQDALLLEASHRMGGAYGFASTRHWLTMYRRRIHHLMVTEDRFTAKDLAINGYDLMKWLKIEQGELIGDILNQLFHVVKYNVFSNNITFLKRLSISYYNEVCKKSA